jgi:excinuclease ABC subunit C
VQALENVLERSAVVLPEGVDADVFGIEHDELAAAVQQFVVRGGRVRGVRSWVVDKELDIPLGELVESVLEAAYENEEPPREILVPALPDDARALETWLSGRRPRGGAVDLRTAQRGDKANVMQTATLNAKQALMLYKTRRTADYVARTQALNDIQEALGLDEAPLRMECYDVSHLGGTNIVASMVVFEDGLAKKSAYRKFAVPGYADDTEALSQVLRRRMAHLEDDPVSADDVEDSAEEGAVATRRPRFAYRPGLLIVDGGQPQVEAAARTLAELGIHDIPVCGLAKRLEEIWLPGQDFPVILPRNSEALFLMQRIRDEAHRFAITFQRQKRRGDIQTVLAEIPGLGPARSKQLLRHFGSVTRLRAATAAEIAEVRGIGPALATAIVARLGEQRAVPEQSRAEPPTDPASTDQTSTEGE